MSAKHAPQSETEQIWRPFMVKMTLIVLLLGVGIFIGLYMRNKRLVESEIRTRARSHFHNIVLTRRWNAHYGGVYVEKGDGVRSNPYLENPDITTVEGKTYTKKNPALMTREISLYAQEAGVCMFHITSLKPLNPSNAPDDFETKALRSFEGGETEAHLRETQDDRAYFRYMAPLTTEQNCLQCHARQGYKVGDIRGGISVRIDITDTMRALRANTYAIIGLGISTVVVLLAMIYFFILRLMKRLADAHKTIQRMVVTDELTELFNRRYLFGRFGEEFKRAVRHGHHLSCIVLDIDHFKNINDTYGHQTGDVVLQGISRILRDNCRAADTVARYGGEEFIEVLPETNETGATAVAEKIRGLVEREEIIAEGGARIRVTVSVGVASLSPEELRGLDSTGRSAQIIKFADEAMYRAKQSGRNRVDVFRSQPSG